MKKLFKKILIANRGEIAVRIIRACKELDIQSVSIYSDVDKDSLHVKLADEAICVGPASPGKSYLNIPSIIAACEVTGADIKEVGLAIGTDKRIGPLFLNAGPGFGGSCFKKDILNLTYICDHYGLSEVSNYWQKVIDINNWQNKRISELLVEKLFGTISGKKIGILGFAFKANTNDIRESPAINICKELILEGCTLSIYDPKVNINQIKSVLGANNIQNSSDSNIKQVNWEFVQNVEESAYGSDALVIVTEWDEFKNLNWQNIANLMRRPSWVFDTRSITDVKLVQSFGINVWRVGLGN